MKGKVFIGKKNKNKSAIQSTIKNCVIIIKSAQFKDQNRIDLVNYPGITSDEDNLLFAKGKILDAFEEISFIN